MFNTILAQTNNNTDWVASSIWATPWRFSYVTDEVLFRLQIRLKIFTVLYADFAAFAYLRTFQTGHKKVLSSIVF